MNHFPKICRNSSLHWQHFVVKHAFRDTLESRCRSRSSTRMSCTSGNFPSFRKVHDKMCLASLKTKNIPYKIEKKNILLKPLRLSTSLFLLLLRLLNWTSVKRIEKREVEPRTRIPNSRLRRNARVFKISMDSYYYTMTFRVSGVWGALTLKYRPMWLFQAEKIKKQYKKKACTKSACKSV